MKQQIASYFSGNYSAFYSKYLPNIQKAGGDEYKSVCPFHEDSKPSFCFNNQTGSYFCHGCGKKGGIFHFYAKLNSLDTRRDFGKILKGIAKDFGIAFEQKKSKMVKAYDYTDVNGDLLYQVCRMEPKDFRQRRPDGKGGFIWNLKGIEPVLYRLPDIMKAQEILVVEGEKDADNLAKLGFVASTCPMGAKKWRESYNEYLEGKKVVLIPDNDNEGREHMAQVGASLSGKTANLKLVELPGLPSKGDVSDFIESFKSPEEAAERLAIMIEQAEAYHPPKKYSIEDAILTTTQFCELEIPERKCYLSPWLRESSLTLISGWRGVGKSFFGKAIADAVSKGKSFGPWENQVSVPCLFLDGEMAIQDMMERSFHLGLNSGRPNLLYIYCDAFANRLGIPRAHLASESWRTKMKSILIARKIKLWIIDNLASLASGLDENAKKDYDPINQWLLELRFAGISTILLHHTNKEGGQRGTSAREDNIDASILLKPPHDYIPEDGARFIVHFSKARVPTRDLKLVSDTEFRLIEDESGNYLWTHANVKQERRIEAIKMLDEGFDQKSICESLEYSKGQVSKIKSWAINEGILSKQGKLTPTGFNYVYKISKQETQDRENCKGEETVK